MATRYSGNATIRIHFTEMDDYGVSISAGGRNVYRGTVGAPAVGFGPGVAYDSSEAFDETARAALSFAIAEAEENGAGDAIQPEPDAEGAGWAISRRRKYYPKDSTP
jgi:hypothetical protein